MKFIILSLLVAAFAQARPSQERPTRSRSWSFGGSVGGTMNYDRTSGLQAAGAGHAAASSSANGRVVNSYGAGVGGTYRNPGTATGWYVNNNGAVRGQNWGAIPVAVAPPIAF